jgi:probable HAF family extracellular repeat protein
MQRNSVHPAARVLANQAFGVNDLGHVIGLHTDTNHNSHAFELRNGHYRNIDLPGGPSTQTIAFSINDFDEIVGYYQDASNVSHGFIATRSVR